jgi:hypothetical protein
MNERAWSFLLVAASFALYIGNAVWSRASSTKEFYVAGGCVSPLANGMATAADWMSAASFISLAGLISFMGYDGTVYLMGWTGGYVLLALCLAPYLRKFGAFTVPDFVGDRYYSQVARVVAVICAIFVSFTYVAGQMRGVGIVFGRFLEVDINVGVYIGMAIVFFYAVPASSAAWRKRALRVFRPGTGPSGLASSCALTISACHSRIHSPRRPGGTIRATSRSHPGGPLVTWPSWAHRVRARCRGNAAGPPRPGARPRP